MADDIKRAIKGLETAIQKLEVDQASGGADDFLNIEIPVKLDALGAALVALKKTKQIELERQAGRALMGIYIDAVKAYKDSGGDARKCLNALGITDGKRGATYPAAAMFYEYLGLLHGTDPGHPGRKFDRYDALEILHERHQTTSIDATVKILRRWMAAQKREGATFPRGLIPGNPTGRQV